MRWIGRATIVALILSALPLSASAATCPQIDHTLQLGDQGSDVSALQTFLQSTGFLTNASSAGLYDTFTQQAVQSYQARLSIVSSGSPATTGWGLVGQATRSALAACKTGIAAPLPAPSPVVSTSPSLPTNTAPTMSDEKRTLLVGLLTQLVALLQQELQLLIASHEQQPIPLPTASCDWNGQTLEGGTSVTSYESAVVPDGDLCVSEIRTCTDGALSGSYAYDSCTMSSEVPPNVTFTAASTTLVSGNSTTLSWDSSGADSCTGVGFDANGTSGSVDVAPSQTTTYSIRCGGAGGSAQESVTINVHQPLLAEDYTAVNVPQTCNSVVFSQVPGHPNYFIGRRGMNGTTCADAQPMGVALFRMDWATNTMNFQKFAFPVPAAVTLNDTAQEHTTATINAAFDASIALYNGELWVAWECAGTVPDSTCIGPFDFTTGTIDANRTTVVVEGKDADPTSTYLYSAAVPAIFVYGGRLYVYWSAIQLPKTTKEWLQVTIRGMELSQEQSGLRRIWGKGSTGMPVASYDEALNTEIASFDPSDPTADQEVDNKGVYTDGNYVYLFSSIGGRGASGTEVCVRPSGTGYGCWRMEMFRSASPLGIDIFNEHVTSPLLPMNTTEYQRPFVSLGGNLMVMGKFYTASSLYTYPSSRTLTIGAIPPGMSQVMMYPLPLSSLQFTPINRTPWATLSQSLTSTVSGSPVTISWNSAYAGSCTLVQHRPDGSIANIASTLVGGRVYPLTMVGTHHFIMDCTGPWGSVHREIDHTVTAM